MVDDTCYNFLVDGLKEVEQKINIDGPGEKLGTMFGHDFTNSRTTDSSLLFWLALMLLGRVPQSIAWRGTIYSTPEESIFDEHGEGRAGGWLPDRSLKLFDSARFVGPRSVAGSSAAASVRSVRKLFLLHCYVAIL